MSEMVFEAMQSQYRATAQLSDYVFCNTKGLSGTHIRHLIFSLKQVLEFRQIVLNPIATTFDNTYSYPVNHIDICQIID